MTSERVSITMFSGCVDIADEGLGRAGHAGVEREPEPEIPVRELVKLLVEAAVPAKELPRRHYVRAARRDEVAGEERAREIDGARRRLLLDWPPGSVEHDRTRVDELGVRGAGREQLAPKLLGRPEIVVVEERDPLALGSLDPGVAGLGDTPAPPVRDDTEPTVARSELGQTVGGFVRRAIVDDHDLELHTLLREGGWQGSPREEPPSIPRGNDDSSPRTRHASAGRRARTRRFIGSVCGPLECLCSSASKSEAHPLTRM